MSKLSLIEQSKKAQTCSSSSSSSSSSLSTSTVASRIASSKSTSITTSSKRRSTTSRQQHHQHQQHNHQQQQQQQRIHLQQQLISQATSSTSAQQTSSAEAEPTVTMSSSSSRQQQLSAAVAAASAATTVHHESADSTFSSSSSSIADEQMSASKRTVVRPVSALELRLRDKFRGDLFEEADDALASSRKTFQHEEEESRVRRREESTCISTRKRKSCLLDGAAIRSESATVSHQAAAAAAAATTTATSMQTTTSRLSDSTLMAATTSSSSSSLQDVSARHFRTSASLLLSDNHTNQGNSLIVANSGKRNLFAANQASGIFLTNEADFSSPDARSIFREVGSEFAMLESAMIDSAARLNPTASFRLLQPGLNQRRPLSPLTSSSGGGQYLAIAGPTSLSSSRGSSNSSSTTLNQPTASTTLTTTTDQSKFSNSLSELSARLNENRHDFRSGAKGSSERIRELLNRVQEKQNDPSSIIERTESGRLLGSSPQAAKDLIQDESSRKSIMSESIERIDQRMSDLCVKLQQCKDSKEAIDLLKIIIQMIEKAWSVPVCGDDLGFKLCNSLREAGGLDFVLGFIQDTVESLMRTDCLVFSPGPRSEPDSIISNETSPTKTTSNSNGKGLKLDLRKVNNQQQQQQQQQHQELIEPKSQAKQQQTQTIIRDNDSDIITSDLGLDSTSVESLSYASPAVRADEHGKQQPRGGVELGGQQEEDEEEEKQTSNDIIASATEEDREVEENERQPAEKQENDTENENDALVEDEVAEPQADSNAGSNSSSSSSSSSSNNNNNNNKQPEIEEPAFLCARLLSQCLTSENRDYIVRNALDSVIRLACSFSTIKSSRIHRLLSCGSLGSEPAASSQAPIATDKRNERLAASKTTTTVVAKKSAEESTSEGSTRCEHSDVHAAIGTEILQHLFKHSEETCHRMISLGGLQAILYGCRSSNVEVLRHCASALANLALYGGPDGQQRMIEQKAHVWLFPLAFNEDDNVQYYACLAIVVLVANKEIEADVLKSSTLDLVEPFVLSHEPQRFAESTTAHIHGQSASWLRKLIPLLESKRQEARNLACFHFAMEAHIKREQSQTELFREIGAVEPLRKVGSSPQAIASRFACQALRLIGEKEPHKLSQQVPLWTSEDVVEWVSQIGFEAFRQAFLESRVDGDLLLQLDEDMLRTDIGIGNGIIRRRFLRELTNLKRISDYSSIDKTGLCSMLTASSGQEFIQYAYPLLQLGVTKDTIHLFDCEQLLRECKVINMIHQIKLAQSLKDIQERQAIEAASQECNSQNGTEQKTLDVFVSYRRSTGSQLASLLKVHLQLRGFSVFIDVERLEAGKFDNNLLDSIKAAKNFIIVLSPSALDRCVDDHGCKDWVHKEIVAALASNCNIIPIIDNFHWPDPEQLPEDMRSIIYFNGVRWIHDYQDACIDKVERFIRGEINNPGGQFSGGSQLGSSTAQSSLQRLSNQGATSGFGSVQGLNGSAYSISSPSMVATPSPGQYQFSRPPPFDGYHHPLSYISQQLQQHSQSSQATAIGRRN